MEKELLHKYFSNTVSDEELLQVLDWVEASPENRRELESERLLFDVSLFADDDTPAGGVRHIWRPVLLGMAAAVLVLAGLFGLYRLIRQPEPATMQAFSVPAGGQAQLMLPDGTHVWLNAQSTLRYPTDFGQGHRDVTLDGEAYFEVAKNEEIPFNVLTEHNRVQVVGTHFTVTAYQGRRLFEAVLTEGCVDIYNKVDGKALTRLTPNQFYRDENGKVTQGRIGNADSQQWRDGIYRFDDQRFADIMRRLEQYYGVAITVCDSSLQNWRCTGKFKAQDGVEHILRVLQEMRPFKYTYDEEKAVIVIR